MNQLADEFKFRKLNDGEFEELRGEKAKDAFRKMQIPFFKIPAVLDRVRTIFKDKIKRVRLIKGMKEVLLRLKKEGYRLGILTSSRTENVKKFLKNNYSIIFEEEIINYTHRDDYILDEVTTAITYESNLEKAEEIMI